MSRIVISDECSTSSVEDGGIRVKTEAGTEACGGGGGEGGGGGAGLATVGRLVDSSQADDRRMIQLVRSRRLLYARNNMPVASYYAQVKGLWEEVANEMGRSVAEVRRKWSHIRNSYSRHLRNEVAGARTGRGRAVSRWYLADELEFLKEHMATDTRIATSSSSPSMTSVYSYTPTTFLEVDMAEAGSTASAPAEPVDIKPFANASWLAVGAAGAVGAGAARLEPKQEPHSVYSGGEDSSSSFAAAHDEEGAYFQFFRGLYGDYSELCARRRRLFRRQCLALLHALLDEQDALGDRTPPAAPLAATLAARHHDHDHADAILPND